MTPARSAPDLAEVLERRRLASDDAARPDAVARAARERAAHRARERRGPVRPGLVLRVRRAHARRAARAPLEQELIEKTPGRRDRDAGSATVGGAPHARCSPTTTRSSPARRGSATTARPTGCSSSPSATGCRSCCSPRAAAGGRATPTLRARSTSIVPSFRTFARLSGLVPRVGIVVRPLLRRQRRAARLLRRRHRDAGGAHRDGRAGDDRGRRARHVRARGGRAGRRAGAERRDRRRRGRRGGGGRGRRSASSPTSHGPARRTGRAPTRRCCASAIPADPQARPRRARRSSTRSPTPARCWSCAATSAAAISPRSRGSRAGRSA